MGLDVDYGAVAGVAVGTARIVALFDADAGAAGAGDGVEDEADDADDQGTPEGGQKIRDVKVGPHHVADEVENECVNDEEEEAEGDDQEREGQEHQDWTNDGVEDSEQQRGDD